MGLVAKWVCVHVDQQGQQLRKIVRHGAQNSKDRLNPLASMSSSAHHCIRVTAAFQILYNPYLANSNLNYTGKEIL